MSFIIYLISFLEGFTTLSIEIIAIRRFTPIIGTNSISTSIILGVILLALSYGYYIGGKNASKLDKSKIIRKIILNLSFAGFYYLAFTFIFDFKILSFLIENFSNYFLAILISSSILFFIPVFLASQTIPLLSEILKGENTGEKVGKLLFFSTVGSFLGSVLTSSLLFPTFGVYLSSVLNSFILSSLSLILSFYLIKIHKKIFISSILGVLTFILSLAIFISGEKLKDGYIFKTANSYHDIEIFENDEKRLFLMNKGFSSGINKNTKESFFNYIKEIKKNILEDKKENKKILIIGAAGFTLPQELAKEKNIEKIDVVDIDSSLKEIAEKYFLQKKLDEKITFIPDSARFFLNKSIKNKNFYDAIILDIYIGKSLPAETLTKEFFEQVKNSGKIVYLNLISDKNLETTFSKKIFNTLENIFSEIYYLPEIYENNTEENYLTNIVVTNKKLENYLKYEKNNDLGIYTDDKHSIENDLFVNDLNNF